MRSSSIVKPPCNRFLRIINANVSPLSRRGMIPHHEAAMEMCDILLNDLTCTEISDIDNLDGLVHLCAHIAIEQDIEVDGMRRWLEKKGVQEKAPCPTSISRQGMMMESCGQVAYPAAVGLIEAKNHKMHSAMAVDLSCDHSLDFFRGMLPHHEGAIAMCDVLMDSTSDGYLIELCGNITRTQYAEIAWMREWLDIRATEWLASCSDCEDNQVDNELPCEDLLSTGSFCHSLGQDGYCKPSVTMLLDKLQNVAKQHLFLVLDPWM